jgi:arylsulfatase A-like enzyme
MTLMTRRTFQAAAGATVLAACTTDNEGEPDRGAESSQAKHRQVDPPNMLVILADDLGWADLSSYGAPEIRTPNIDRLARSGIRFTDGYAASSVCSPTRFGLYTGRYPGRLPGGLPEPIGVPSPQDGIPVGHPTLASLLKKHGYETAMFGKWHCGYLPWFSPTKVGWDTFFGNFAAGLDYFSKINLNGNYDLYENDVEYKDLRYYTHLLTERAVEFVQHDHDRPWLLNLNFTTPHWPWEGPQDKAHSDELMRFIERKGDPGYIYDPHGGSPKVYRSMVEDMDRSVGRVLAALEHAGQSSRTLVFFASDNGGDRYGTMTPLQGGKFSLNEGGIRVPTIVSWPGTIEPHQEPADPVVTMDWTATFLDLGGAQPDPSYPLDGISLRGLLLDGETPPERDLFWRLDGARALRRGGLKYIQQDDVDWLFDLVADPGEYDDLSLARQDDFLALKGAWEAIDAQLLPY